MPERTASTSAKVLGQAFVDPEQVAFHRLLVVAGREARGAAVLAVPAMGELVRQQVAGRGGIGRVDKGSSGNAIVAGLMMLQAEVRHRIAERDQEVILAVVMALVERACLAHQAAEVLDMLRRQVEVLGPVGCHIEKMLRSHFGRQRNLLEVLAGEHGRIDQHLETDRVEAGGGDGSMALVAAFAEGRAELPCGWQSDRRSYPYRRGIRAFGINDHGVPTQHREVFVRGGSRGESGCAAVARKSILICSVGNLRDGQVEGVHLDLVALPLQPVVAPATQGWPLAPVAVT